MTPEQLKRSILFAALQGKIVERKENELVPDLSGIKNKKTEEIGFDIPSKWQIAHLESISESIASKQYQIAASAFKAEGCFPVVSQSKEYIIGYCNDKTKLYHHNKPVIVFGDHTAIIKFVDFDFVVGADGIKIFEPNTNIITAKFFSYVLDYYSTGLEKVGGYSRHYKFVKDKPFPIPPLEEQHRIVAKIEELIPYVDRYAEAYETLEQFNAKFPEDMKKSILQYAIQGKLVEQRPEEGTAEELYQQIQKERKRYKIKELSVEEISDVPFDIPETWLWIRLQNIVKKTIKRGKSPKYAPTGNVQVFAQKCNVKTGGINMDLALFLDEASINKYSDDEYLHDGDIVINSTGGGTMGRVGIFHDTDRIDNMSVVPDSHVTVIRACDFIDYKYLYYFIKQNQAYLEKQGDGSTNQIELKPVTIASLMLPLPPLKEQHRIVTKIEELVLYCDKLKEHYVI